MVRRTWQVSFGGGGGLRTLGLVAPFFFWPVSLSGTTRLREQKSPLLGFMIPSWGGNSVRLLLAHNSPTSSPPSTPRHIAIYSGPTDAHVQIPYAGAALLPLCVVFFGRGTSAREPISPGGVIIYPPNLCNYVEVQYILADSVGNSRYHRAVASVCQSI